MIVELELKSVTASCRLRSLRLLEIGLKSGSHMIDSSLIETIVATIEKPTLIFKSIRRHTQNQDIHFLVCLKFFCVLLCYLDYFPQYRVDYNFRLVYSIRNIFPTYEICI